MNRGLFLITLSMITWGIGDGIFFYFQPLYLEQLGANPVQIGSILGFVNITLIFFHPVAGALVDRFGAKQIALITFGIGGIGAWLMFAANSLPFFTAALMIYFVSMLCIAPISRYVTGFRGSWTVTRAITTVFAGFYLGMIIGPIIGGQFATAFGLRACIGISASVIMVSPILIALVPPLPDKYRPESTRQLDLLSNKTFLSFLLLILFGMFTLYINWPLTPNFLQNIRQVKTAEIGFFGSLNALGALLLALTLGRLPTLTAFLIAQLFVAGSSLLLWQGPDILWFAIGYFLAGGFRVSRSLSIAFTGSLVAEGEVGLAYGIVEAMAGASLFMAAPIAGILYRVEPSLPYPASLGLIALSITLTAGFSRRFKREAKRSVSLRE